ncbi:calcium-transporting ATPase, partial [Haematococcus lacustris]
MALPPTVHEWPGQLQRRKQQRKWCSEDITSQHGCGDNAVRTLLLTAGPPVKDQGQPDFPVHHRQARQTRRLCYAQCVTDTGWAMYAGIGMTLQDAFARDYREVAAYYNVDVSQGLSEAEAAQARNKYGRNELEPEQSGWLASSSHCPLCAVTGRVGTAVQQAVDDSSWHPIGIGTS